MRESRWTRNGQVRRNDSSRAPYQDDIHLADNLFRWQRGQVEITRSVHGNDKQLSIGLIMVLTRAGPPAREATGGHPCYFRRYSRIGRSSKPWPVAAECWKIFQASDAFTENLSVDNRLPR
jgi:hypothetical protein